MVAARSQRECTVRIGITSGRAGGATGWPRVTGEAASVAAMTDLRFFVVGAFLACAVLLAACGDADGEAAQDGSSSTGSVSEPDANARTVSELDNDGLYLAADDIEEYIAVFEDGVRRSSFILDGEPTPVEGASIDENTVTAFLADGAEISVARDDDDEFVSAFYFRDETLLTSQDPGSIEMSSNEDEVYELIELVGSLDGPDRTLPFELRVDERLTGSGSSNLRVDGNRAFLSGTVGTRTYSQIQAAIDDGVDTFVLVSVPGSENDAINVHSGRLIRATEATTIVARNGDVASGGTDLFVSGANRIAEPGAFIGVHSWSDGETEGAEVPRDDAAHRSQLEYFTEMLGEVEGPEFYWFTLEAAPASRIHRMSRSEIESHGLITESAAEELPAEALGFPAAYVEVSDGVFEKAEVRSCDETPRFDATLFSPNLGEVRIRATGASGSVTVDVGDTYDGVVSDVDRSGDVVSMALSVDGFTITGEPFEQVPVLLDCEL